MKNHNELKHFFWKGIAPDGKKCAGDMLALSEPEVRAHLNKLKIRTTKFKARKPSATTMMRNRAKPTHITMLSRQLATMLDAGVPLIQSIKMIRDGTRQGELRAILAQVCSKIEAGTPLSQALKSASPLFDTFYCDLVAVGEQTGHLAEVFKRITQYREKTEALRKKVVKAMIYPGIVSTVAIGVTVGMLLFVIPQFDAIFRSFNTDLPWFTQKIVDLSNLIQQHGLYLLLGIIAFVFTYKQAKKRSESLQLKSCRTMLKIPIFGPIFGKAAIARISRTLATTFSSGIPILSGLLSASQSANNLHFKQGMEQVHMHTAAGSPLYLAMRQSGIFPEMVLEMVMIGEESGSLDDMLNRLATIYEAEVDNTVDNLGQIIEPMIILILGGLIGSIVVAMYLPIFNLMSVVG